MSALRERARRWLASDAFPLHAALLSLVLCAPALAGGYFLDDVAHRTSLDPAWRAHAAARGDWDLFRFASGEPGGSRELVARGLWPWWTAPDLRLAFFRPISSLWHALDFRFLAAHPWLLHLESLLVHAALVWVVAHLARELLGRGTAAGLAGLVYAIDDAHATPVAWISNRNALLASALGLAAVLAHARGRRGLGVLWLALGLASGEAALAALPYLLAWGLWLDPAGRRAGLRALAPYAAPLALHALAYAALGYGTRHSGLYVDPVREPLSFAAALLARGPLLALAGLLGPPADLAAFALPEQVPAMAAAAAAALAVLLALLVPALRRAPRAAPLAFAALGSLVPFAGVLPGDRSLLVPGAALAPLLALVLVDERPGRAARGLRGLLFVVHVALPLLVTPLRVRSVGSMFGPLLARASASYPEVREGDVVVVLSGPDPLTHAFVLGQRLLDRRALPASSHLLATSIRGEVRATRPDDHTVEVALDAGFVHDPLSLAFRGPSRPFALGEAAALPGLSIEVLELRPDGRPARVRFRFARSLDDPSVRLVAWGARGFEPVTLERGATRAFAPFDPLRAAE